MSDSGIIRSIYDAAVEEAMKSVDADGGNELSAPLKFIASTGTVDRQNDTVNPKGWKLKNFRKSGAFLWAHERGLPPIGRPVGAKVEEDKLIVEVQFTPPDMPHPYGLGFGDTIRRMYKERYMRAVSVGFIPLKAERNQERGDGYGYDITSQELAELSAVPVPANPEALHQAKHMGIDTRGLFRWAEDQTATDERAAAWARLILRSYEPERTIFDMKEREEKSQDTSKEVLDAERLVNDSQQPMTAEEIYQKTFDQARAIESRVFLSLKKLTDLISKQDKILSAENAEVLREAKKAIETILGTQESTQDNQGEKKSPPEGIPDGITAKEFEELARTAVERFDTKLAEITGRLPR